MILRQLPRTAVELWETKLCPESANESPAERSLELKLSAADNYNVDKDDDDDDDELRNRFWV